MVTPATPNKEQRPSSPTDEQFSLVIAKGRKRNKRLHFYRCGKGLLELRNREQTSTFLNNRIAAGGGSILPALAGSDRHGSAVLPRLLGMLDGEFLQAPPSAEPFSLYGFVRALMPCFS